MNESGRIEMSNKERRNQLIYNEWRKRSMIEN